MRKIAYIMLPLFLAGVLFSVWKIISIETEIHSADDNYSHLAVIASGEKTAHTGSEIGPVDNNITEDYSESVSHDVMFIKHKSGSAPNLCSGKVVKVTGKSIVVEDQTGDSSRIMLPEDESECLPRVIVMSPRVERSKNGMVDASGYPVLDGDSIAYMKRPDFSNSAEFEIGKIEAIKGNKVLVNGTRKTADRIVVINW